MFARKYFPAINNTAKWVDVLVNFDQKPKQFKQLNAVVRNL